MPNALAQNRLNLGLFLLAIEAKNLKQYWKNLKTIFTLHAHLCFMNSAFILPISVFQKSYQHGASLFCRASRKY